MCDREACVQRQTYLCSYLNGEDKNVHGEDDGLSSDLNGEDRHVYREEDEQRVASEAERRFERGNGFWFHFLGEERRGEAADGSAPRTKMDL